MSSESSVRDALFTSVSQLCMENLKTIMSAFSERVSEQTSDRVTKEEIVKIWNEIAPNFVIKSTSVAKSTKTKESSGTCQHKFVKGKNEGELCGKEVSDKSTTHKYCSKHLKNESDDTSSAATNKEKCQHILTSGNRKDEKCGATVSKSSETGKFCGKHYKANEQEQEKPKQVKKAVKDLKLVPKMNAKLGVRVDTETGYIIEKGEDNPVYAKLVDGEIVPLTEEDKEILVAHNYVCDDSLLQSKHPELFEEE